jgi:hypothetical protein
MTARMIWFISLHGFTVCVLSTNRRSPPVQIGHSAHRHILGFLRDQLDRSVGGTACEECGWIWIYADHLRSVAGQPGGIENDRGADAATDLYDAPRLTARDECGQHVCFDLAISIGPATLNGNWMRCVACRQRRKHLAQPRDCSPSLSAEMPCIERGAIQSLRRRRS